MTGKKESPRDARDRQHGNAGWTPCFPCKAYGTRGKEKCTACNGLGFIRRNPADTTGAAK